MNLGSRRRPLNQPKFAEKTVLLTLNARVNAMSAGRRNARDLGPSRRTERKELSKTRRSETFKNHDTAIFLAVERLNNEYPQLKK